MNMEAFRVDALSVEAHPTHDQMAAAAATAVADGLRQAITQHGRARVIFASAASQIRFLEMLTREHTVDWGRITGFHMDEYLGIDAGHPASFRRFLRERLTSRVRFETFEFIQGEAEEPLNECDRYTARLQAAPIDLCVLGIGENGHVAFNDPPVADFEDPRVVKLVALDQACRLQQVGEGAFPSLEAVPRYAYTLTVPALCAARRLVCVVPESRKADAVRQALQGPISTACPASVLRRQPHATLYLDANSAAGLSGVGHASPAT
jgi:glucosamine-6-phosphate deaminase